MNWVIKSLNRIPLADILFTESSLIFKFLYQRMNFTDIC